MRDCATHFWGYFLYIYSWHAARYPYKTGSGCDVTGLCIRRPWAPLSWWSRVILTEKSIMQWHYRCIESVFQEKGRNDLPFKDFKDKITRLKVTFYLKSKSRVTFYLTFNHYCNPTATYYFAFHRNLELYVGLHFT